jgi:hypothetical protein
MHTIDGRLQMTRKPSYFERDLNNANRRLLNSAFARGSGSRGARQRIAVKCHCALEAKGPWRSKAIETLAEINGITALTRTTPKDRGLYSIAAERQTAARDRRVLAEHDPDVGDGARSLSVRGSPARSASSLHPSGMRTRSSSAREGRASSTSAIAASTAGIPRYLVDVPDGLIAERKVAPFRLCRQGRAGRCNVDPSLSS